MSAPPKRSARVLLRTALLALAVAAALALQFHLALSNIMSGVMTLNAQRTKSENDDATHKWSLEQAVRWNRNDYHALYRLGSYHLELRDDATALPIYERCIERSPHHLGALLALADLHTRAGNLDQAARRINLAREVAPTSWRTYLAAGTLAGRMGEHERAVELLEKADRFTRHPQVGVYNQMAVATLLADRPEESLSYAKKSIALTRKNPEGWLIEGKARLVLGQFEEAVKPLQRAAAQSQDQPIQRSDARLHLAGALTQMGHLGKATKIVRDEVAGAAHISQARATLVNLLESIEAKLKTHPVGVEPRCNLGMTYLAMGQLAEAGAHFAAAAGCGDPRDAACIWAHAETTLRLGRAAEAAKLYEQAMTMGPPPFELRLGFAGALAQSGRNAEARLQYMLVLQTYTLEGEQRRQIEALMNALN